MYSKTKLQTLLFKQVRNSGVFDLTTKELIENLAIFYGRKDALPQVPVLLAKNARSLKDSKLTAVCENEQYFAEPKIDGIRMKIHFTPEGIRLDGKNISTQTFQYTEYTEHCNWLKEYKNLPEDIILDAEVRISDSTAVAAHGGQFLVTASILGSLPKRAQQLQEQYGRLQFHVFDVINYEQDWRDRQRQRRLTLESISIPEFHKLNTTWIYTEKVFQDTYQQFLEQGYEGIMLKNMRGYYPKQEGSRTRDMYKYKKWDTVDAFITGVKMGKGEFEGLVGSLELSILDGPNHRCVLCYVSPGNMKVRQKLQDPVTGELRDEYKYKVVEVEFQERTPAGKLRHPKLARQTSTDNNLIIRIDKDWSECYGQA